jgi:hypothetical protein
MPNRWVWCLILGDTSPMSLTRMRVLVVVGLWAVFVGALYLGVPPPGQPLRPLLWMAMVLVSLRVMYGAVRSNRRPGGWTK